MHLTESLSNHMNGMPVVHEVAAVIASEYFNTIAENNRKSLALVTAGPGLTNTVTGIAGAWLEGRFVLILGGQVKTTDLKKNTKLRQRGIQEIDGVKLVESICKVSIRIETPIKKNSFISLINHANSGKKGPIFLEFPLDIQAINCTDKSLSSIKYNFCTNKLNNDFKKNSELIFEKYCNSKKHIVLVGGGVDYSYSSELNNLLKKSHVPIMTTYNGADRVDGYYKYYFGNY